MQKHPIPFGNQVLFLITNDYKKTGTTQLRCSCYGAPEGTRTPDLLIRSQTLYPAELLAHVLFYSDIYITTVTLENQL